MAVVYLKQIIFSIFQSLCDCLLSSHFASFLFVRERFFREYILGCYIQCGAFAVEIQHFPRGDRNEFVQKYKCIFTRVVQSPGISHFIHVAYHVRTYYITHISRYIQGE